VAHGTTDIFANGEGDGGITVGVGDSGALARVVQRILNDAALRVQFGTSAHQSVATYFSQETVGRTLEEFMHRRMAEYVSNQTN
jgi:glycosyltransferase involved in cell wall biosynthesis